MKQRIILKESDLHDIIAEAVNEVLSEGQGWDFVKHIHNQTKNRKDYDMSDFKDAMKNSFVKKDGRDMAKNYVKTGDEEGTDAEYYDSWSPSAAGEKGYGNKKINKSFLGKMGRAASVPTAAAVAGFNAARNSFRNKK